MASSGPSDDELRQLAEFTGLDPVVDRDLIARAFQEKNRNLDAVISQFFDDPESVQLPSPISLPLGLPNVGPSSGEDIRSQHGTIPCSPPTARGRGITQEYLEAFHVESTSQNDLVREITPPLDSLQVGAPSRPPSRARSRSPLGGMLERTASHATGMPSARDQEEDDMQRALRESAQEAGITLPQQDVGVIPDSTSSQYFGPANRADYDHDSWAMVPRSLDAHDPSLPTHLQDQARAGFSNPSDRPPPASTRKRTPGAPAFLVEGLPFGQRGLGGLLTVLHEIPLARNALLSCGSQATTHSFDDKWWTGKADIISTASDTSTTTSASESGQAEVQRVLRLGHELHRLTAFLDTTERSYGSPSDFVSLIPGRFGVEKRFYELIKETFKDSSDPFFHTARICDIGDNSEEAHDSELFGILELEHVRGDYRDIFTLYEAIDHMVWADTLPLGKFTDEGNMGVFTDTTDIFAISIGGDGPTDSIDIPLHFYPERYMIDRQPEARRIQKAVCEIKADITALKWKLEETRVFQSKLNNQHLDKAELFKQAKIRWSAHQTYLEGRARFRAFKEAEYNQWRYPTYRSASDQLNNNEQPLHMLSEEALGWIGHETAKVTQIITECEKQIERAQKNQRFLGQLLTQPDKAGRPRPMTCKEYSLRGVIVADRLAYVCRRLKPELIELDQNTKQTDQWWRLAADFSTSPPVVAERVEVERVFREMWTETKTPLLIYATEHALTVEAVPISAPLDLFLRADNKAFRRELSRELSEASVPKPMFDPLSPTKRKHRDSMDSMDSNRASLGSVGDGPSDNPFADQPIDETFTSNEIFYGEVESLPVWSTDPAVRNDENAESEGRRFEENMFAATLSSDITPPNQTSFTPEDPTHSNDAQRSTSGSTSSTNSVPEMQERARPPPFLSTSQTTPGVAAEEQNIDMGNKFENA